jgi:CRISPR-associated endonuclease/helicase Cas3
MLPTVDVDLHAILAKTHPPESLVDHTGQVLSRLADLHRLRPRLAQEIGQERFWHWLYWGGFLHDFGKAADGFQAMMQGKTRTWGFRHEALSLAFVDWLFPEGHSDRIPVIAVIACHHRDAAVIYENYHANRDDPEEDSARKLISQLSPTNIQRLYRWLTEYSWQWAEALGFAPEIELPPFPTLDEAAAMLRPKTIHRAVIDLKKFSDALQFSTNAPNALLGTLLRGFILMSDHAGSAGVKEFPAAPIAHETITQSLDGKLFPHQEAAADAPASSCLLISPTSSGKTEAAMLWLAQQQVQDELAAARIFYILPYQASMNAIHGRLQRFFGSDAAVGLQHGRMMQVLYASALANEMDNDAAQSFAHQQAELARLLGFPVTVMSPYQILKVPYQLKGFESLLANFYGGRFVLDEIHAYEPKRLAMIIAMLQFLAQHCQARFFIMTATLPHQVQTMLQAALPDLALITADTATFQRFQRHRVHLLEGDLLAPPTLARIAADARGNSVLICCNTVRRAAEVYERLESYLHDQYPAEEFSLLLLHSRFNHRDRSAKERKIMEQTGVKGENNQRTIVIATQVVEVSLNIDLDTLYTEAAPLEALLQRFGRVNRSRPLGSPLADVYVVKEQPPSVKRVYDMDLLDAALDCLAHADGQPIDESMVGEWLKGIYQGAILERWQSEYDQSWHQFQTEVLSSLNPFNSADLDSLFYRMFDGMDVLPSIYLQIYEEHIRKGEYQKANGYLVPIAWRDYNRLEKLKRAWYEKGEKRQRDLYIVNLPYSTERGLDIYSAYQSGGTANNLPKTDIDNYEVPPEAD